MEELMLQRYDIVIERENNSLSIGEFAALGRTSRKNEKADPLKEEFVFIQKIIYDGDKIQAAIDEGTDSLISELRSDDFFPIRPCAELIAKKVTDLLGDKSVNSSELFF